MTKKNDYTLEQQRALAWLEELERQIRVIKAAIYLSRYEPERWDEAVEGMAGMKETAAAGPGEPKG